MSKEAMKLALEALENWLEFDPENFGEVDNKAITALREALAEQPAQQEPVGEVGEIDIDEDGQAFAWLALHKNVDIGDKLYTSPPAQRTWVGLVWGELPEDGQNHDFLRGAVWAETKLKEKNQ